MSEELFDRIIVGVKNQNRVLVDNIGIKIKLESCPNYKVYVFCEHALYGSGRLSAFWCQHIRPYLFPKRQAYIESIYGKAELQFRQELLDETIKRGKETC